MHLQNRLGEVARRRRSGDEPVHTLLDELDRCIVRIGDDDRRRSPGQRLHDDEAVTFTPRRKDEAEGSPECVFDDALVDEAGRLDDPGELGRLDLLQHRRPVGTIAVVTRFSRM